MTRRALGFHGAVRGLRSRRCGYLSTAGEHGRTSAAPRGGFGETEGPRSLPAQLRPHGHRHRRRGRQSWFAFPFDRKHRYEAHAIQRTSRIVVSPSAQPAPAPVLVSRVREWVYDQLSTKEDLPCQGPAPLASAVTAAGPPDKEPRKDQDEEVRT